MALRRRGGDDGPKATGAQRDRRILEPVFVRVVATAGIVGIGTAIAAILGSQDVAAWIIGLVISTLAVVLGALLWSARTL